MMQFRLPRAALVLLPLAMWTTTVRAESADLQRVEISGQRPAEALRYDVRRVCSSVEDQLQRSLAMAAYREGRKADIRVQFKLRGSEITEVSTSGLYAYRTPVRRAVHSLDCGSDASGEQNFAFLVSFRAEDEAQTDGRQRVAIRALGDAVSE